MWQEIQTSTNVFIGRNSFSLYPSQVLKFTYLEATTTSLKLLKKGPNLISQSFKKEY